MIDCSIKRLMMSGMLFRECAAVPARIAGGARILTAIDTAPAGRQAARPDALRPQRPAPCLFSLTNHIHRAMLSVHGKRKQKLRGISLSTGKPERSLQAAVKHGT